MKIEHIAMYVNELEAARDFFVTYLGGKSNDGYHNKTTDEFLIHSVYYRYTSCRAYSAAFSATYAKIC